MTFINIIYKLPDHIKTLYRNIERNQNKITKNIWSIKFNEICLTEEILQNYTKIRFNLLMIKVTYLYIY